MNNIERIIKIADDIYLWNDITADDYAFFSKYLSKMIPKWYTWNFEDVVSEVCLYMKELYDISADVYQKKRYIEVMVFKKARVLEEKDMKLCEWWYSIDWLDILCVPDNFDIAERGNVRFIYEQLINKIEELCKYVSVLEQDILIRHILKDEPLINISNDHPECSYQRVCYKKDCLIDKLKILTWYLLEKEY